MTLAYMDTSALFKLVVEEHESAHLESWLEANRSHLITSSLSFTELPRAARRAARATLPDAYAILKKCAIVNLDRSLFEYAARIDPPLLRSLDALHLSAAIHLGSQLDVFVSYDDRLLEAARHAGFQTASPRA